MSHCLTKAASIRPLLAVLAIFFTAGAFNTQRIQIGEYLVLALIELSDIKRPQIEHVLLLNLPTFIGVTLLLCTVTSVSPSIEIRQTTFPLSNKPHSRIVSKKTTNLVC